MAVAVLVELLVGIAHGLGPAAAEDHLEPDRLEAVVVVAVDHAGRAGDALPRPEAGRRAVARLVLDEHVEPPLQPEEGLRTEEHTSELQSLMRISYAVFSLT